MADTESWQNRLSEARACGFKALDPMADTERCMSKLIGTVFIGVSRHSIRWRILKVLGVGRRAVRAPVSRHSIRWRILKERGDRAVTDLETGFKALDPMADTESDLLQIDSIAGAVFQGTRSDGGY